MERVQREYGITDRTKSLRGEGVQRQETGQSPFWKNHLPVTLFLVLFPLSEQHVLPEQWVSPTYSPTEGKRGVQQPIY